MIVFISPALGAFCIVIATIIILYMAIGFLVAFAMRDSGESTEPFMHLALRWPEHLKCEETEDMLP